MMHAAPITKTLKSDRVTVRRRPQRGAAEDLSSYEPKWLDQLRSTYRGYDVTTNNPPGGGVTLIKMPNTLERSDLVEIGHNNAEYIRVVCEAMKRATIDKDKFIGDPGFVDVPISRLASKDYAIALAKESRHESEPMCRASIPDFPRRIPPRFRSSTATATA